MIDYVDATLQESEIILSIRNHSVIKMQEVFIKINDKKIGLNYPPYIIAEMSANHAGSLNNVAHRICEILKKLNAKSFLRICADSPFIDPELIDKCIIRFNNTNCDIVTNVLPRTFPKGQSVEVVRASLFIKNLPKMKKKSQLEHILNFFYENIL